MMTDISSRSVLISIFKEAIAEALALKSGDIDLDLPFVALGGDSLSALYVCEYLSEAGWTVEAETLVDSSSITYVIETVEAKDATADT